MLYIYSVFFPTFFPREKEMTVMFFSLPYLTIYYILKVLRETGKITYFFPCFPREIFRENNLFYVFFPTELSSMMKLPCSLIRFRTVFSVTPMYSAML